MSEVRAVLLNFSESWVLGIWGLSAKPLWLRSTSFVLIGEPISGLYWPASAMKRTADGRLLLDVAAAANAEKLAALRNFVETLPIAEIPA